MKIEISEIPENVEKIVINIDTTNKHIEYTSYEKKEINQHIENNIENNLENREHVDIPEEMNSEF